VSISLPIPPFDRWGNLDAGRVEAGGTLEGVQLTTLADMRQRFVTDVTNFTGSVRRSLIWDGWMRHRGELDAIGLHHSTLVNGSFTTREDRPRDVDLCYLLDGAAVNGLGAPERARYEELFDHDAVKAAFMCDVYSIACYPVTHLRFPVMIQNLAYWSRVWGEDRHGRRKCVLMVGCGPRA
jgi:hypothetical protein